MSYEEVRGAARTIGRVSGRPEHAAAVVLGSGLSSYGASLDDAIEIPYARIPGFPVPQVEGHSGSLYSAVVAGTPMLIFAGRVHAYEGWDLSDVVFGVRTAALAGAGTVLLTNAAGGVGEHLAPGDLVAIRDHINFTARNPLEGPNDERFGPRFPDMSSIYDGRVLERIDESCRATGVDSNTGVYAWFLGPSYESPAEVEMARRAGADLVGMSTVPEAIALRHMGVAVGGISLVTNLAAGISATPLSHDEVTATAIAARDRFTAMLDHLLPRLAA